MAIELSSSGDWIQQTSSVCIFVCVCGGVEIAGEGCIILQLKGRRTLEIKLQVDGFRVEVVLRFEMACYIVLVCEQILDSDCNDWAWKIE